MLEVSRKLRLEQDEQVKLMERLKEQKSLLLQAEHRLNPTHIHTHTRTYTRTRTRTRTRTLNP